MIDLQLEHVMSMWSIKAVSGLVCSIIKQAFPGRHQHFVISILISTKTYHTVLDMENIPRLELVGWFCSPYGGYYLANLLPKL
jgi:hypothetical protein